MLNESGLRIGSILTDLFGLSGRNLLDGLLAGQAPEQMGGECQGQRVQQGRALEDPGDGTSGQLRSQGGMILGLRGARACNQTAQGRRLGRARGLWRPRETATASAARVKARATAHERSADRGTNRRVAQW